MKKRCAEALHAVVLRSMARNNALLHSVALRIMLQHGASCRGVVRCAAAMLLQGEKNQPVWHSSKDFFGGGNNQPVWHWPSFWPWWL